MCAFNFRDCMTSDSYDYAKSHGLIRPWDSKRLLRHNYANVFIDRTVYGDYTVRSYCTEVLSIDRYGYLSVHPNAFRHSQTTSRHIRWILEQLAPNVSVETARSICKECVSVQIDTGEISERTKYNGK